MIFFLYGPDTYRSKQKLQELLSHYQDVYKNGLNMEYLDLNKVGFEKFFEEFQQGSMFNQKKLIVLKNTLEVNDFKERFLLQKKFFLESENIILFYEEKDIKKEDTFLKFLKKHAKIQLFSFLKEKELKNWIKKEFTNYSLEVDDKVVEIISDFVGNDLWRLSNEIKKLAMYRKDHKIEVRDVDVLVRPKIETDIFKTIDAIASKNKNQALELINKHLERGDSALYLLSMIGFQFKNILLVKEMIEGNKSYQMIISQTKLHPYVVKKSYFQSRRFTFLELKNIYRKIFQADVNIKTGKIDPETALDLLIAGI